MCMQPVTAPARLHMHNFALHVLCRASVFLGAAVGFRPASTRSTWQCWQVRSTGAHSRLPLAAGLRTARRPAAAAAPAERPASAHTPAPAAAPAARNGTRKPGPSRGVFPAGCRWRTVKYAGGAKRPFWAVEEYEWWDAERRAWTAQQPAACLLPGAPQRSRCVPQQGAVCARRQPERCQGWGERCSARLDAGLTAQDVPPCRGRAHCERRVRARTLHNVRPAIGVAPWLTACGACGRPAGRGPAPRHGPRSRAPRRTASMSACGTTTATGICSSTATSPWSAASRPAEA